MRGGSETVVTNLVKALGQDVKQKAAQKLDVCQRAMPLILRGEGYMSGVAVQQAGIGDADAMGVSAEVAEDLVCAAKGPLCVDDPTLVEERSVQGVLASGRDLYVAGVYRGKQRASKPGAKQLTHDLDGEEVTRVASDPARCFAHPQPASAHDGVHMGMEQELASPSVQHHRDGRRCAQAFGVVRQCKERLTSGLHEHGEDELALGHDEGSQFSRQCEHDVEVRHRQDALAPAFEPAMLLEALATGAVPVATSVVDRDGVAASVADVQMSAERSRATTLEVAQDGELLEAQRAGVPQRGARDARDISELDARRCGFVSALACRQERHVGLAEHAALLRVERVER